MLKWLAVGTALALVGAGGLVLWKESCGCAKHRERRWMKWAERSGTLT